MDLQKKYPPSAPCSCELCVSYCKQRPGWWSVDEAEKAMDAGYAERMMLELAPEKTFSVLSPAFKGNECNFALQANAKNGCTFLNDGLCELFGTDHQPLECRFCHHERQGMGIQCHFDIEKEWNTERGKRLVIKWGNITGFWMRQGIIIREK
jgi:hypothetical protein